MKRLFLQGIIVFVLCSCSKGEISEISNEIELKLDYTFIEGGDMTRGIGSDVYENFYEKYIKTKKLTPKTYNITFSKNGTEVLKVKGKWGENNSIRLPEGNYSVYGESRPIMPQTELIAKKTTNCYFPSDSVYMSFKEDIAITKDMDVLTLTATYDSFLLLFDASYIAKINLGDDQSIFNNNSDYYYELPRDDKNSWLFMRDKGYSYNSSTGSTRYEVNYGLYFTRKDDNVIKIRLKGIPFEKGKYYYFNDMTNSFDIPPMESGN